MKQALGVLFIIIGFIMLLCSLLHIMAFPVAGALLIGGGRLISSSNS